MGFDHHAALVAYIADHIAPAAFRYRLPTNVRVARVVRDASAQLQRAHGATTTQTGAHLTHALCRSAQDFVARCYAEGDAPELAAATIEQRLTAAAGEFAYCPPALAEGSPPPGYPEIPRDRTGRVEWTQSDAGRTTCEYRVAPGA